VTDTPDVIEVRVSGAQFHLGPFGTEPVLDPRQQGRLLFVDPAGATAVVLTGCAAGPVSITVDSSVTPLADLGLSLEAWEVGEEDTIDITEELLLSTLDGTMIPIYVPSTPGPHLVRVLARGRAANWDLVVSRPTEVYTIAIRPANQRHPRRSAGSDGLYESRA
jgi:hypothetical protein